MKFSKAVYSLLFFWVGLLLFSQSRPGALHHTKVIKENFFEKIQKKTWLFRKIWYNNNYKRDRELVVSENQPRHDTQAVQFRFSSILLTGHGRRKSVGLVVRVRFSAVSIKKFKKKTWLLWKNIVYFNYSKEEMRFLKWLLSLCLVFCSLGLRVLVCPLWVCVRSQEATIGIMP